MIINNEEDSGLGKPKPKWKKHLTFKNAVKLAVAPQLLIPKKNLTFGNIAKAAFAPQMLLVPKKKGHKKGHSKKSPVPVKRAMPRPSMAVQKTVTPVRVVTPEPQAEAEPQAEQEPQVEPEVQAEPEAEQEAQTEPQTAQEEGTDEIGLGRSKMLKKVNLKGTLKAVKFAAPLLSMIPVVGGPASKLMDSQLGRFATKAANSKAGKAARALSKTKMGKQVISSAKARLLSDNPQADADMGADTGTGVVPVTEAEAPKNNTLLYVAGGAALLAVGYLATRKSN